MKLTFDDGPSEWTPAILDLLAEHGQTATFFVIGEQIPGRWATVLRMFAEGHKIGNHSFTHRRLTELGDDMVWAEFEACDAVVRLACGSTSSCWRAPMFGRDERIDRVAAALGLGFHVGADVVPDDWNIDDAEKIAAKVLSIAVADSVVCLHDGMPPGGGNGTASRQPTVDAVRLLLEARP